MVLRRVPATIRAVADSTVEPSLPASPSSPSSATSPPSFTITSPRVAAQPRTIVLLMDGTGDQYDEDNSNVVKLFQALVKSNSSQHVYYQSGVGTYTSSAKASLKGGLSAALDAAIGSSLGVHVREAYQFLMATYREGDKISIFAFSRGAYAARALCGMVTKCGLLPRHNASQVPFAWKWYCDDSKYGWNMSADFKRTFSIDCPIYYLGCWDTVASVGVIPRILPLAKSDNSSVRYFRHALALDERRAKFKANHWYQRHPDKAKTDAEVTEDVVREHQRRTRGAGRGTHVDASGRESSYGVYGTFDLENIFDGAEQDGTTAAQTPQPGLDDPSPSLKSSTTTSRTMSRSESKTKVKKSQRQLNYIKEFNEKDAKEWGRPLFKTDVEEVWFAGCHADVGGGAVPNTDRHQASRIPLRWMIREAFKCNTGLLFRTDVLAEHGLDVETLYPKVLPRKEPVVGPSPHYLERYARGDVPTLDARRASVREAVKEDGSEVELDVLDEAHEDYFDAIALLNDQLVQAKVWWILELAWPIKYRIQDKATGVWRKKVGLNLGRHRTVRELEPKLHWSVRQRERWAPGRYKIKTNLDDAAVWQTVM